MKISEAVEKALKEDKGITRKSLQKYGFEIHPTNSGECCYVVTKISSRADAGTRLLMI